MPLAMAVGSFFTEYGGELITAAVAVSIAIVGAVAAALRDRRTAASTAIASERTLRRDAYTALLAAAGRLGSALPDSGTPDGGKVSPDVKPRVDEAMATLFETAALAMIVGSEDAREEIMRLQAAALQLADVAGGSERTTEAVLEWSRAKTNLLELARFEAGVSRQRPKLVPEPPLDPLPGAAPGVSSREA
jgi:hypothetical protein